jgi:hypothetical protein
MKKPIDIAYWANENDCDKSGNPIWAYDPETGKPLLVKDIDEYNRSE